MKLNGNTSKRSAAAKREAADFAAQERSAHRSGANRSAQSEAAARRAAAGQNHLIYVGISFSGEKGDGEGIALFAQVGHAVSGEQVQPGMLQGVAQDIQDRVGHVGAGVDFAVRLRHRLQSQGGKVGQSGRDRKLLQGIAAEIRVPAMVVVGGGVEVGEVAAAVAGREELAAHPGLTLGEEDGVLRVLQGR